MKPRLLSNLTRKSVKKRKFEKQKYNKKITFSNAVFGALTILNPLLFFPSGSHAYKDNK